MKNRSSTKPNQPSWWRIDRERIQEDDLDVEDDEEHRREVEADREALLLAAGPSRRPTRTAAARVRVRGPAASRTRTT